MVAMSRPLPAVRTMLCLAAALVVAFGVGYSQTEETSLGMPLPVPMSVAWTFSMGAEPSNTLKPVVVGDRVYVSHGGKLRCVDLQTGEKQWEFAPKPEEEDEEEGRVSTSAAAWGDLVIVGTDGEEVYGLNAADGTEVWKAKCEGSVKPDPLIFNDFVILAGRRHVYALDPLTGDTRWETEMASPVFHGPITDGSGLYFLGQDGSVQGVAARDGRLRWRSATLYGPQAFPPIVAGGRIVVASGNRLVAVARTGHPTWTAEMPTGVGAQPTVAGDTLYVPCVDGKIYPLYPRSGRMQRRASIDLDGAATSPLLVVGGMMLGGTSGAQVVAADLAAGEVQWAYRCRGPDQPAGEAAEFGIYAPLVESDGYVLALTGAGDLYCFSPSAPDVTGPLFSEPAPEPGSAVSGKETVKVSFVVVDDGSGLNPASVRLTVDGKPARLKFESITGKGELDIREMADGIHIVKAEAADFRGNTGSEEWSFLTDKSIPPKPEEEPRTTTTMQRTR